MLNFYDFVVCCCCCCCNKTHNKIMVLIDVTSTCVGLLYKVFIRHSIQVFLFYSFNIYYLTLWLFSECVRKGNVNNNKSMVILTTRFCNLFSFIISAPVFFKKIMYLNEKCLLAPTQEISHTNPALVLIPLWENCRNSVSSSSSSSSWTIVTVSFYYYYYLHISLAMQST